MTVRLLLDENLSERLLATLDQRFPGSQHIRLLGLGGAPDGHLWERAKQDELVLVTKDEDFVVLSVLGGPPPKVIWLNVGNANNAHTAALLLQQAPAIEAFVADPESGFLALGFGPGPS